MPISANEIPQAVSARLKATWPKSSSVRVAKYYLPHRNRFLQLTPLNMSLSAPQGLVMTAGKVHIPFKSELLSTLSSFRFERPPHLLGILATKKEDARTYAEFTRKACEQIGIHFELRLVGDAGADDDDDEGGGIDVEEAILEANDEVGVDGIMVYYPIYGGRQDQYLQSVVSPMKDVEGLNHQFLFNLYHKSVRPPLFLNKANTQI